VCVQSDAIETTTKTVQKQHLTGPLKNCPMVTESLLSRLVQHLKGRWEERSHLEPWGTSGSTGVRVDSDWWWISEGPEADERLQEWLTVIRDTTESTKTGFLFQQPIWDFDQLAAEHSRGEESLYELPSVRYTGTLKYTEDLMLVVILDEPLTADSPLTLSKGAFPHMLGVKVQQTDCADSAHVADLP
jgi:hypothetical protein